MEKASLNLYGGISQDYGQGELPWSIVSFVRSMKTHLSSIPAGTIIKWNLHQIPTLFIGCFPSFCVFMVFPKCFLECIVILEVV